MKNLTLATFALLLCGCASSSIKSSWKSPTYPGGPVKNVAVVAVDGRPTWRQGLENRFLNELRRNGQESIGTHELIGLPEIKADKESATARMRTAGADAVLIVRLVDQSTYSRGVKATPGLYVPTVAGFGGYGWYDYYAVAFTDMGVTWGSSKQNIYLDSSLFELKTGQRLWSALTLTVVKEQGDRLVVAEALIAKIVEAMRKDGVVR